MSENGSESGRPARRSRSGNGSGAGEADGSMSASDPSPRQLWWYPNRVSRKTMVLLADSQCYKPTLPADDCNQDNVSWLLIAVLAIFRTVGQPGQSRFRAVRTHTHPRAQRRIVSARQWTNCTLKQSRVSSAN